MTWPAVETLPSEADFDAQMTRIIKAILNLLANFFPLSHYIARREIFL
jgi:ArsR family metal-binding transcriptional regulator